MNNINEFIQKYRTVKMYPDVPNIGGKGSMAVSRNPHVVCKDGFEMSVQCGQSLYSSPRDEVKRYSEVEIGFPSAPEPLNAEYAEDWEIEGDDDPRPRRRHQSAVIGLADVKTGPEENAAEHQQQDGNKMVVSTFSTW